MQEIEYTTDEMIHFATQYLVSAVQSYSNHPIINFYDSLEFCNQEGCLKTKPFNEKGDQLCLHYRGFILEWCNENYDISALLFLQDTSHQKIIKWISEIAWALGFTKPFKYEFHSTTSCPLMYPDFTFKNISIKRLIALSSYRLKANEILDKIIKDNQLEAEVCSWTSDFDTVAYTLLSPKTDMVVALGITPPTFKANNEQKLYISIWRGLKTLSNKKMQKLNIISKKNSKKYLASIPFKIKDKNKAVHFFNNALNILKQEYYLEMN